MTQPPSSFSAFSAFSAPRFDVTPHIALTVLKPFEAAQAGVLCASMDPWARYPVTAAQLTSFFAQIEPGAPRFAIRVDGVLEGAVAVRSAWLYGPYIQTFALARGVQGRGVGTAVMAFIEREARRVDARNLWVAASDFNDGAHRFYARLGFQRIAELDALVRDDRTEVLLRKRLDKTAG